MQDGKTTPQASKLCQRRGKLAAALRENLKRRKAKPAIKPATDGPEGASSKPKP